MSSRERHHQNTDSGVSSSHGSSQHRHHNSCHRHREHHRVSSHHRAEDDVAGSIQPIVQGPKTAVLCSPVQSVSSSLPSGHNYCHHHHHARHRHSHDHSEVTGSSQTVPQKPDASPPSYRKRHTHRRHEDANRRRVARESSDEESDDSSEISATPKNRRAGHRVGRSGRKQKKSISSFKAKRRHNVPAKSVGKIPKLPAKKRLGKKKQAKNVENVVSISDDQTPSDASLAKRKLNKKRGPVLKEKLVSPVKRATKKPHREPIESITSLALDHETENGVLSTADSTQEDSDSSCNSSSLPLYFTREQKPGTGKEAPVSIVDTFKFNSKKNSSPPVSPSPASPGSSKTEASK